MVKETTLQYISGGRSLFVSFRQRYLGGTLLSQLLLVSTETVEPPRLSTYMSLDYSGVRLELYLSGVYVYRDDLHCPS